MFCFLWIWGSHSGIAESKCCRILHCAVRPDTVLNIRIPEFLWFVLCDLTSRPVDILTNFWTHAVHMRVCINCVSCCNYRTQ
jgi:hypothetical protein